jgi:Undecaprenyl-phosphate glucose phosphotransferase
MLKKHAHAFIVLLWAFDTTVLAASFAVAYLVRFFAPSIMPAHDGPSPIEESLRLLALAVPIWSFCFASLGLYGPRRTQARRHEIYSLAKATALGTLLLVFLQYFSGEDRYSRGVILLFAATSFVFMSATRLLARQILAAFRARGFNKRRAVIIGANRVSTELIHRLQSHPEFGIEICAVLGADSDEVGSEVAGYRVTGTYDELSAFIHRTNAEQVYLALAQAEHARLASIHRALATETVDVRVVPDLVDLITLRGGVEDMDGLAIVHLQAGPLIGLDAWIKRGFDLVVTIIALAVLSPVMLLCALLVKITSRGPILYRQERIGLDGRIFKLLKFRSMPVDAEASTGAVWAKADDNRARPFGALMRRYSLDELPQLFNVLKGDMSLVGPRPERPVFIDEFKKNIPRYNLRHKIKAGITGLAQVEGWRGDTSLEKRIECDLEYIENWSLWLDVKILVRTGLGGFLSRNAY